MAREVKVGDFLLCNSNVGYYTKGKVYEIIKYPTGHLFINNDTNKHNSGNGVEYLLDYDNRFYHIPDCKLVRALYGF